MRSYDFGGLAYDGERQVLQRDKAEVALTPKCRELLMLFLENPARPLSRQEITRRVWPDTAVTDNALSFQIAELRNALGEEGGWLKTVTRVGYRWDAPAPQPETPGPDPALAAEPTPKAAAPPRPRRRWPWAVALLVLLAGSVLVRGWRWPARNDPTPAAPESAVRVAVLPLAVLGSGNAETGVGLADLLGLRLSLFPGLVVRSTATVLERTQDKRAGDPLETARALDVDVLLDGSLTIASEGLDVRLRLLDGKSGRTLWTGEARAAAGDRVAVEQRLVDELVRALGLSLEQITIERWAAPASADVAQTFWRAQALSLRGWRASQEAQNLIAAVIAKDPTFAPAYTLKSQLLGLEVGYGVAEHPAENHRLALLAAKRGVELDPQSAFARSVLGGAMADMGDLDGGAAQAAVARDAAPSRPSVHLVLGWLYRWAGLLDRAERAYETAFQLDASLWRAGVHLAYVATLQGDQAKAEAALARLRAFGATAETAALEMQAWRLYNLRDWSAAEEACRAIAQRPSVLNYCPRLDALLQARRGDPGPARRLLAKPSEASYPDGRRRFDRAALCAAVGDRAGALAELQAAETYGFQTPQALRFDPDLSALLDDPPFHALLGRWEARRARRETSWR